MPVWNTKYEGANIRKHALWNYVCMSGNVGLYNTWTEINKIHSRFCKKKLGIPRCAANGKPEIELFRNGKRGNIMSLPLKYWQRILRKDYREVVKKC
jgi:hypothetical protein